MPFYVSLYILLLWFKRKSRIHTKNSIKLRLKILTFAAEQKITFKLVLLAYEAVRASINDQVGWWGHVERVIWVWVFLRGSKCAE